MTVVVVVVAVVVSSIRVSSERGHNCFSHSVLSWRENVCGGKERGHVTLIGGVDGALS